MHDFMLATLIVHQIPLMPFLSFTYICQTLDNSIQHYPNAIEANVHSYGITLAHLKSLNYEL
ncbi:hypothetical protein GCM10009409_00260 [Shewanella saliphila]|uniref:Uncharacterized protein n=1 Tax=Shewanella saliphila TaxID=2282698 RepID=A0ABQ2Q0Y7_9GAMM|nr:hypothetical protein GCM10009409_00260 [Shewanella saliphila]